MLTEIGIKGLGNFFRFTGYIKTLPFIWDKDECVLSVKPTQWQFIIWFLISLVEAVNGVRSLLDFLWCALLAHPDMNISHMLLALHITFASGQILGMLFAGNIVLKLKENVECYNQLLKTNAFLRGKFRKEKRILLKMDSQKINIWANILMHGLFPWVVTIFFFNSGFVLVDSQDRRWGWHLVSSEKDLSLSLLMWAIYEGYLFTPVYCACATYFFIFPIVFPLNVNYWLEFLSELDKNYGHDGSANQIDAYKSLRVLMTLYNDCHAPYAWPIFIGANIHFHVLCNFVCIGFRRSMHISGLIFLGGWSLSYLMIDYFAYPIGGKVFEKSSLLLQSWGQHIRHPIRMRQLKALHPIAVTIGSMFRMERMTPLVVMNITSTVTLNLLLLRK